MTFKYEKLLLLKSPQIKVTSNIVITKQSKTSQTYICQGHYEIKLLILQTSQLLNVIFHLKNSSLGDGDNNDFK